MATNPSAAAAAAGEQELVITCVFDAPRDLVFKAWTEPERAARWWGPQGFALVACEADVRPGGAWRRCLRAPDGTELWKRGVYREIVEPERLVFTYADEDASGNPGRETLVTVIFADICGKTRLTLHQVGFASRRSCDLHRAGWASCLDRLAEHLIKN
ncbi:MAG TPA: SRPBCC domain-containing protein [Stellaceae bacterium]|nr:SRPBCC domain-containing protein [Stellaceae bacterium]